MKLYKVLLAAVLMYCSPAFSGLIQAIEEKQAPKEIKRMIAEGADVNEVDYEFLRCLKPVLRYALDRGRDPESVEIITMLIDAGADVNAVTYNRIENKTLYGMMPLLTYAAIYSPTEIVQALIDAGAQDRIVDPECPINFKKTALMIAQELGKTDVVKVLEKASQ